MISWEGLPVGRRERAGARLENMLAAFDFFIIRKRIAMQTRKCLYGRYNSSKNRAL